MSADYPKQLYQSRFYQAWSNMKRRCNDSTNKRYAHYGARGIGYDPKWEKFSGFYEDMFSGYDNTLTLDRIDNDKGYSLENCRWATISEQMNNMSTNHRVTINGVTKTMAQWIVLSGIKSSTVHQRINAYGWSIYDSLFTPTKKWSRS